MGDDDGALEAVAFDPGQRRAKEFELDIGDLWERAAFG
jgi:hypothetical protein